jgi:hypothetical protein
VRVHSHERSRDKPGNNLVWQSARATPADDPAGRPEADRHPRTIPSDAAIESISFTTGFCSRHSWNPTGGHVLDPSMSGWHQPPESSQRAPLSERRVDIAVERAHTVRLWNVGYVPVRGEQTRCRG